MKKIIKTRNYIYLISLVGLALSVCFIAKVNAAVSLEARPSGLSQMQLDIWNNPVFQKQFTESYIAETEIEPKVTVPEREQMQKVLDAVSSEDMEKAIGLLSKNLNEASSAVFDFTLANIYFQQENLDAAVKNYKTAVEKYPKFRRAWRNLGIIFIRQSDFEQALPCLTKVIELGGADSMTYGLLGFAYSNQDNNLSAESAYRLAILLDPQTMDWQMGLARSLFKQQRYAEAVSLCAMMIAKQPERADLWMLQANAYIGLNQPLKAAENYELVERLGKSTAESLNMLGDIYINQELFDLAVDAYIKAMEKDTKKKPDQAIRAAKVLTARGAFSQTKKIIKQIETTYAEQLSTQDIKDMLKLRARIAVSEGAGEDEAKVLEEIVALDPLDGEALILLGQHKSRNNDIEKAFFYFERAASIEKFEADAKVRSAQLLVKQGKYNEALPLLRRAQMLKPREDVQKYLEQVERIAKK